jgi:hypothetical protein
MEDDLPQGSGQRTNARVLKEFGQICAHDICFGYIGCARVRYDDTTFAHEVLELPFYGVTAQN